MTTIRRHLTYANVVSTLCLFIAVAGGAAYAADTVFSGDIVDDEVFSADVRDDTLPGGGLGAADLRAGSVSTSEVANGSLRSADVRDDTQVDGGLAAADLAADSVGTSEVDGSLAGEDILDGSVTGAEIAANTLTGSQVIDGSLSSLDILNNSIASADVADDSLTGADINDATVGKVSDADKLDGLDSSRLKNAAGMGSGSCDPLTPTAATCASVTLPSLTAGDDVYLSARWQWNGRATGEDTAQCEISRGAADFDFALFGQNGSEHNTNDRSLLGSLIGLDSSALGGANTYTLRCFEKNGDVQIVTARIVALRMSG